MFLKVIAMNMARSAKYYCLIYMAIILLFVFVRSYAQVRENYICFSMNAAEKILKQNDLNTPNELQRIGYITQPVGVVVDQETNDLILIGKQNAQFPLLYLDDFVVTIRTLHKYEDKESPGVSIDPDPMGKANSQVVNYFGGVSNTRFGKVCYEADYLLKKMSFGLEPTGSRHVITPWEKEKQWMKAHGGKQIKYPSSSRVWFYPGQVYVLKSTNALLLYNCNIHVMSQFILGKGVWQNPRILPFSLKERKQWVEEFVHDFSIYYDEIAQVYPVLEELRSLVKLYAICTSIRKLQVQPNLHFWLSEYPLTPVETPVKVDLIKAGEAGFGYAHTSQGGIYLKSLASRIIDGDPSAFEKAVLLSRPSPESLSWVLQIDSGSVQIFKNPLEARVNKLLAQADYFLSSDSFKVAIEKYMEVSKFHSRSSEILSNRAIAWLGLKNYKMAMDDCNKALEMDSSSVLAWSVLGYVSFSNGNFKEALDYFTNALRYSPELESIRVARAFTYFKMGILDKAEEDCDYVLQKNPESVRALTIRVRIYEAKGLSEKANEITKTIAELNPDIQKEKQISSVRDFNNTLPNMSLELKKKFPITINALGKNLWETNLSVGIQQDVGNLYYPTTAALFGLGGQFAIAFTLSNAVIINNRLRFDLTIPFELRSAVINSTQFDVVFGRRVECEEYSLKALGIGGGFNNAAIGAYYLLLDGLWNRPTILLNFNLLTGIRGELFSTYWLSKSGGASIFDDEKIQFGQDGSFFIAGVQSEFPVENVRLGITGSFMPELNGERLSTGLEGKLRFPIENSNWASGFGLAIQTVNVNGPDENRNDLRFSGTLEMYDNSIAFGIGSSTGHRKIIKDACYTHLGIRSKNPQKQDFSGKYIFIAWNIKASLLNYRKWFQ